MRELNFNFTWWDAIQKWSAKLDLTFTNDRCHTVIIGPTTYNYQYIIMCLLYCSAATMGMPYPLPWKTSMQEMGS